ncbi:MAG: RNA methyltransferase [Bacteroidetes bacterium HGW-Bacteroidetes-1]|jgi:TrmH family RNA methyltransferase|nr:MAG: RNA methyltransferase [Bacteroidetes bacterium HGW-Bacteroidetes-1]
MESGFFMLSKNRIKYINSLKINKFRKQNAEFIVEGTKLVKELLQSNFNTTGIYITHDWLEENGKLLYNSEFEVVDNKAMKLLSNLSSPPGILAIAGIPSIALSPDSLKDKLSIALDGINDPGNLGTIIRTADWFGIKNIFCSHDTVDAYHPKVIQATMGSIFRVEVIELDLNEFLGKAITSGINIYGALMNGNNIYESNLTDRSSILVIGSESHGIREYLLSSIQHSITVPAYMSDDRKTRAESLNASIAAALILAEFRRLKQ